MSVDIASLAIRVDSTAVGAGVRRLSAFEDAARGASREVTLLSRAMGFAGSSAGLLTAAVTATGAAMAVAVSKAIPYQAALAKVSTIADETKFSLSALSDAALEQALSFGKLPVDQVNALYDLISSGAKDSADAIDLLTASNNLAIGGLADVGVATDALTSVLNAYGEKAGGATAVSDAMFVAMRDGKVTVAELGSQLGTVAPIAATLGVSFDELTAAVAALTSGGVSASETMTGIKAILSTVAKPTKEAADMAAQLGLQFDSAALKARGFSGFLQDVFDKSRRSTDALSILFGGVEALVPVMALAGATGDIFNSVLGNMATKAGATQSAVDKMSQTTQFQLDRISAALDVLAVKTGSDIEQGLLPSITSAADGMAYVARHSDDLVLSVGLLASALGGRLAASLGASAVAATELQRAMALNVVTGGRWGAVAIDSVAANAAKARSSLVAAQAAEAQAAAELERITVTKAALAVNRDLAIQQRAQAAANVEVQRGISEATGRTEGYTQALAARNQSTRAVLATTQALRAADAQAVAAQAALTASSERATAAQIAHDRALKATTISARAARAASSALAGTMAFFGGPIGLAITALSVGVTALAFSQSEAEKAAEKHRAAMDSFNQALKSGNKEAGEMDGKLRAITKARLEDAIAAKKGALSTAGADIGSSGTFGLAGQAIKYGAEAANAVYSAGVAYRQLVAAGDATALDQYVKRLEEIKALSPDAAAAVNAEFEKVDAVVNLNKDIAELSSSLSKLDDTASDGASAVEKVNAASARAGSGGVKSLADNIANLKAQLSALQTGGKEALALVQDRIAAEAALTEVSGQADIGTVTAQVTEQRRLQEALKQAQDAASEQVKSRKELEGELTDAIKKASEARTEAVSKEVEARKAADEALKRSVELEMQAKEQREGTTKAVKKALEEQAKADKELDDKKKQLRADDRQATQEALDRFTEADKIRADARKSLASAYTQYNSQMRDSQKTLLQAEKDYASEVKSINADLLQAERDYADEVARIRNERAGVTDDNETRLRELRRKAMSDYEREADIAVEAAERILKAQDLLAQGQSSAAQKEADKAATLAGRLEDVQQAIAITEQATSVIESAADATAGADQAKAALDLQSEKATAVERERDAVVALSESRASAAQQEQDAMQALKEARAEYTQSQVDAAVIEANALLTLSAQRDTFAARQKDIDAEEAERENASLEAKTKINEAIKSGIDAITKGDTDRAKASADFIESASKQLKSEDDLSKAVKASRDIIATALETEAGKAKDVHEQQTKITEQYGEHAKSIAALENSLKDLAKDYTDSAASAKTAAEDTTTYFKGAFDSIDKAQKDMYANAINRFSDMASAAERAGNRIDAALSGYGGGSGSILDILGFATGGVISNDNIPGFATGGILSGPGTGTSDSILGLVDGRKPVKLSNGEGIVNKAAVDFYGVDAIHRMNRLDVPRFADGGVVGGSKSTGSGAGNTYNITIQVSGTVDPDKLLVQINEAAKRASARGR